MPHPWIHLIEAAPSHDRVRLAVDLARQHPDAIETAEALRAIFASPKATYRRFAIHMAGATRDLALLERTCLDTSERNAKLALRLRGLRSSDSTWQEAVLPALSDALRAYVGRQRSTWRRAWDDDPDVAVDAFRQAYRAATSTTQRQQLWARATPLLEALALTDTALYWSLLNDLQWETFSDSTPRHMRIAWRKAPALWHRYLSAQLALLQPPITLVRRVIDGPKNMVQRLPFALLLDVIGHAEDAYASIEPLVRKLRGHQKSALLTHWVEQNAWSHFEDAQLCAAFSAERLADARKAFLEAKAKQPWLLPASTDAIALALTPAEERLADAKDALHQEDADARAKAAAQYLRELAAFPDAWHRELPALLPRWSQEREPTRVMVLETLQGIVSPHSRRTGSAPQVLTAAPTFDPLLRFLTQSLRAPDASAYAHSLVFGLFLLLFDTQPTERDRLAALLTSQQRVLLPQDRDTWTSLGRRVGQCLSPDALQPFIALMLNLRPETSPDRAVPSPFYPPFEEERVLFAARLAGQKFIEHPTLVQALARLEADVVADVLQEYWYGNPIPPTVAVALLEANPSLRALPAIFAATLDLDRPEDLARLAPSTGHSELLDDPVIQSALAHRGTVQNARATFQEQLLDALVRPVEQRDAFDWRVTFAATIPEATVDTLLAMQANVPTIHDEDGREQPLATQAIFQALRTVDQRVGALSSMLVLDATTLPRVGRPFLRRAQKRALSEERAALSVDQRATLQRAVANEKPNASKRVAPKTYFKDELTPETMHLLTPADARRAGNWIAMELQKDVVNWTTTQTPERFAAARSVLEDTQSFLEQFHPNMPHHAEVATNFLRPLAQRLLEHPRAELHWIGMRMLLRTIPTTVDDVTAAVEQVLHHAGSGSLATMAFTLCVETLFDGYQLSRTQRAVVFSLAESSKTQSRLLAATILYRASIVDEDANARRVTLALQQDVDDAVRALAVLAGMSRTPW